MNFGTFLLLQSPAARSSQEIYARGIDISQSAEALVPQRLARRASLLNIDDLLDRFLVIGTPDTCIRQINRIKDLVGITHFSGSFWFDDLERARALLDGALCQGGHAGCRLSADR